MNLIDRLLDCQLAALECNRAVGQMYKRLTQRYWWRGNVHIELVTLSRFSWRQVPSNGYSM